ncbi:ABC transporter permease [Papillibacter cinnamivorans]|uniref:ABC transporter permease n=1 Tax=Papillibacter cinnamivorans TaxID=100176 RepID=UPI00135640B5|nr:ABC transporter permease [Papillibacter cinnamivorans]
MNKNKSPRLKTSVGGAGSFIQKYSVIIAWVVVIAAFTIGSGDLFFNFNTLSLITGTRSVVVILALAIMIPLTAGDYDMSSGFTMTLANMITVFLAVEMGWNVWQSAIIAILVGLLVGAVNGIFVVKIGIDPFIVTMGVGTFLAGVTLWISNKTLSGTELAPLQHVSIGKLFNIQYIFFYCFILMLILWYIFEHTSAGKKILFIGHGKEVARLSGIKVGKVRWICLMASSTLSAFAGVMYSGVTGSARSGSCNDFMMPAFAAAFLGSTFIKPGRFNPVGTFIAVYFLETGIRGLSLLGFSTYVQNLFYGAALVLAVALSAIMKKRSLKADKAKKIAALAADDACSQGENVPDKA